MAYGNRRKGNKEVEADVMPELEEQELVDTGAQSEELVENADGVEEAETTQAGDTKEVESEDTQVKVRAMKITDTLRPILYVGVHATKELTAREVVASKALEVFKARGQIISGHGRALSVESILQLENAMLRGINNGKEGWWQTYEVVETKDFIQLIEKVQK
jgi:hypothetical protein